MVSQVLQLLSPDCSAKQSREADHCNCRKDLRAATERELGIRGCVECSASAADLLSRHNVKQLFRVKEYHRGANCLPQVTLRLALHLSLQPCMPPISRSKGLPAAVGDPKPYRILRFATFGRKTVKNYKEIARHLCDLWQPGDQMDLQQLEGARGDASAVCWHALASPVST